MKIAITGHSTGIGLSLANLYRQHGHEVIGFSRDNGYHISDPEKRKSIIEQSKDCDIFFNNAYHDFSQCDLLFELWEVWQGQKKKIVNVSSSLTMRWDTYHRTNLKYRSSKIALEQSSDFLWNKSPWPAIMCVSPCLTDTPRTHYITEGNKVDPDEFAEFLYYCLSRPNFRVQKLALAVNPLEETK